jgi:hypothetical protein
MNYSIVITTFDKRFESDLIPLISSIKALRPLVEIIVAVNGPCRAHFDQSYRKELLQFLATYDEIYPIVFPEFQSLAKMWNRGLLTASHEQILLLNDDLTIPVNPGLSFFDHFERALEQSPETFTINGSFSHFSVSKQEVIDVGFFDERLLGLGEEDGDFYWRFYKKYKKEISSAEMGLIDNVQSDLADDGYTKGIRTASKFNRDFLIKTKYQNHFEFFDVQLYTLLNSYGSDDFLI